MQKAIYRILVYRSKRGQALGRTLQQAFEPLGLPKGARLEPSAQVPDVGLFETLECPFVCQFYVGGPHGRVLHDSPFLKIPGVDLSTWCIDLLHSWHFGPLSTYVTVTLQHLLQSPIWKSSIPGLDKDENSKLSLMALKAELWTHYKNRRNRDPNWKKKGSEANQS